jgi:hypothetical protein
MVAEALATGLMAQAVHQARSVHGIDDPALMLLAYADPLAERIIQVMRDAGHTTQALLDADQAHQAVHGFSGFLCAAVCQEMASHVLLGLASHDGPEAIGQLFTMAKDAGRVPVVVVAAGHIMAALVDPTMGLDQQRAAGRMDPGTAERMRRQQRSRRASR